MRLEMLDLHDWAEGLHLDCITNTEGNKDKRWTPDGLYSERTFGRMYGDSASHSCACGKAHGRFNISQPCLDCGTDVRRRESLIRKFGAVHFGGRYIVSPFFFALLQRVIGKATLDKIIHFEGRLDIDGNLEASEESTGDLSEFHGRGIEWFADNFAQVYAAARPAALKRGLLAHLRLIDENMDKVLIGFYPVFTHRLRPAIMVGDKLTFDKVNNHYTQLISLSNSLKDMGEDSKPISRLPLLLEMQHTANLIYEHVIESISGKMGFIRSSLIGNRVNYSARMVIVPQETGYDIDEVHLPYLACLELYKFHVMNVLQRTQGLSYVEALREWNRATTKFSRRIYEIMKGLIERGTGARVLVNRNPTLSVGSILLMRLTKIKEDMTDLTMSLSNNVLRFLAADYDGRSTT